MSDVTRRYRQLERKPENFLGFIFLGPGALFALAIALIVQVGSSHDGRLLTLSFFLLALGFWGLLLRSARKGRIKVSWSGPVMGVVLLAMIVLAPATSKDFNSYALYGRMVAEYGASPYTHTPRDFAADAWYVRTSAHWSDSPSVYGPTFTGLSAGVMAVAGTDVLTARLGFQLIGALALIASVGLLSRRIGAELAIVAVGLNPLLVTFGVNDAHCDVLIGLFVLSGVLALERRHLVAAGVALGLAASVKVSLLPAILGAFVWSWFRISRKGAVVVAVSAGAVVVVGLALTGAMDSLSPLHDASLRHTRFSVWNPIYILLPDGADSVISSLASSVVIGVGLYVLWRFRRDALPFIAVCSMLIAYQVLGAYTLSWYAAWTVPALAVLLVNPPAKAFWISMGYGCWLAIAYLSGYGAIVVAVVVAVCLLARLLKRSDAVVTA